MEDRIFLLVKCTITTTHKHIRDAIQELQDDIILQLTDTENVQVLQTEIIKMNTKSSKN
ncbi:hypothetical protein BDD43_4328 [Mucilaginibacter gracilis]|uniref:Uncharacterized protein n=1 Tax=Mucilaginibacter gracilis TaxID=423350 RepID=A0A495J5U8_9SPHI|nr:hypothetical protein [Mucilaginibacter gracilis]RKR84101.1 hypothetical protein BDD43_4328 [Mucilaginibacter gracilis]